MPRRAASKAAKVYTSETGPPDVEVVSSDGRHFLLHQAHLGCASPAFARMFASARENRVDGELPVIHMEEEAIILTHSFKFCYPSKIDLNTLAFGEVIKVFAFLDKFQIHLGRQMVESFFWSKPMFKEKYGLELYTLAARHGLKDLEDACRPHALTQRFHSEHHWQQQMGADAACRLYRFHFQEQQKVKSQAQSRYKDLGDKIVKLHALHTESPDSILEPTQAKKTAGRPSANCAQCGRIWTFKRWR